MYGLRGLAHCRARPRHRPYRRDRRAIAKAFGCVGGYIAANTAIIDAGALLLAGLYFHHGAAAAEVAAAATAAIRHLKTSSWEREGRRKQDRAARTEAVLSPRGCR